MMDEQLDQKDDMAQATLDAKQNPQPALAKPQSPIEKMILASLARRAIRMAGPRFGIHKRKGGRKRAPKHDMPRLL
jgi:hypothetical protein